MKTPTPLSSPDMFPRFRNFLPSTHAQVLIHSNLNYVPGVGYREDAVSPTSSSSHIPLPPPPYHTQQQSSGPTTNARTTGGGGGIVQSSRSVGFVDSPEVVTVVGYTTDDEVPIEPTTSWGELREMGVRKKRE